MNRYERLPVALPPGTMEFPASGWVVVPREVVRAVFPEWSFLLDRGWSVWVNERGELSWNHRGFPPGVCAFCGEKAKVIKEHVFLRSGIPGWDAEYGVGIEYQCRCGAEWYQEIE